MRNMEQPQISVLLEATCIIQRRKRRRSSEGGLRVQDGNNDHSKKQATRIKCSTFMCSSAPPGL